MNKALISKNIWKILVDKYVRLVFDDSLYMKKYDFVVVTIL